PKTNGTDKQKGHQNLQNAPTTGRMLSGESNLRKRRGGTKDHVQIKGVFSGTDYGINKISEKCVDSKLHKITVPRFNDTLEGTRIRREAIEKLAQKKTNPRDGPRLTC
ncbi:11521_t:CDS:2, partial [Ambispora gerdemannii]